MDACQARATPELVKIEEPTGVARVTISEMDLRAVEHGGR